MRRTTGFRESQQTLQADPGDGATGTDMPELVECFLEVGVGGYPVPPTAAGSSPVPARSS
jgi:hypothetical protein